MSKPIVEIYQCKDKSDNWKITPNLPVWKGQALRLLLVGGTGSGKTNMLTNIMLNLYLGTWEPHNIFIISGSLKGDLKLKQIIDYLGIPEENLFDGYKEEELQGVFDHLKETFLENLENGEQPEPSCIILDDVSFSGALKKKRDSGALSEVLCNGRKYLISCIITAQKASQISTTARTQANGGCFWSCSNRELDFLANDFDYTDNKKLFRQMFREATNQNYHYLTIDKTTSRNKMYSDSFEKYFPY